MQRAGSIHGSRTLASSPLIPKLFLFLCEFFRVAGVFAQENHGSYVAAFRTPKHVLTSSPEVFHSAVAEVVRYLEEKNVDLVTDPLRARIETQDPISTGSLVKIAEDSGAEYLLYIIVDRPVAQWLKITLQCFDSDQKMIWQESAGFTGTFSVNSKRALPEIMKKLGKQLAPRLGHAGLMLKKAAKFPPSAEGRS